MSIAEFASTMEAADIKLIFNRTMGDAKQIQKSAGRLAGNFKPKSIAALARDQIMTFPIYMSGEIPAEAGVVIIKALEKQYSVFAMLALANHLNYDSSKYNNIGDVIAEIHNNDDKPNLGKYILNLGANIRNALDAFESTVVMNADEFESLKYNLKDEITTESINNLYRPNEYSVSRVEKALEGDNNREDFAKILGWADSTRTSDEGFRGSKRYTAKTKKDAMGNEIPTGEYRENYRSLTPIQMMEPEKYFGNYAGALTPTVVTSTLTVDKEPRDFMIAIKGTAHVVPKEQMASMLVDAVHNNELAFKIIKWSKGETRFFRDFVFGIKDARDDAVAMKSGNAWLPALKRRKMASKTFVGGGAPISPISTLVISDIDVENVKAATGIDISRPVVARKMIRDYFLLGLMIYNTQDQTIMTMLDADVNPGWANTTLAGLKSNNAKTGSGKMEIDTKDVLKMLGRY